MKSYIVNTEVKNILEHLNGLKSKHDAETYKEIVRLLGFHCMVRFEKLNEMEAKPEEKLPVPVKSKKSNKKGKDNV